jgi:hypothetical protein
MNVALDLPKDHTKFEENKNLKHPCVQNMCFEQQHGETAFDKKTVALEPTVS